MRRRGTAGHLPAVARRVLVHGSLRTSAGHLRIPAHGDGKRVLDAGCGAGDSTAAVLAAAPHARIVAVDASERAIGRARARTWPDTVRFRRQRIEELPVDEGRFDAVFAAFLVGELADPDAGLARLRGLLTPGGVLVVHELTPGVPGIQARMQRAGFRAVFDRPGTGRHRGLVHTVVGAAPGPSAWACRWRVDPVP